MSKNYIEIEHEYTTTSEPDGEGNVWVSDVVDVWYAVRENVGSYSDRKVGPDGNVIKDFPDTVDDSNCWNIHKVHIHDVNDIAALRKLLDAIEAELSK